MVGGYLVVLVERGTQFGPGINPRYRGIYRIPTWPSKVQGENPLLERYIFELVNDDGYIDDLETARSLCAELGTFGRAFEIIHCTLVNQPTLPSLPRSHREIGFDVVPIRGDYLSRVGRFPADERMDRFRNQLNENGLLPDARVAHEFVQVYASLQLPEWDVPVGVFRVAVVNHPARGDKAL
jgi:hypothetical protein